MPKLYPPKGSKDVMHGGRDASRGLEVPEHEVEDLLAAGWSRGPEKTPKPRVTQSKAPKQKIVPNKAEE